MEGCLPVAAGVVVEGRYFLVVARLVVRGGSMLVTAAAAVETGCLHCYSWSGSRREVAYL